MADGKSRISDSSSDSGGRYFHWGTDEESRYNSIKKADKSVEAIQALIEQIADLQDKINKGIATDEDIARKNWLESEKAIVATDLNTANLKTLSENLKEYGVKVV